MRFFSSAIDIRLDFGYIVDMKSIIYISILAIAFMVARSGVKAVQHEINGISDRIAGNVSKGLDNGIESATKVNMEDATKSVSKVAESVKEDAQKQMDKVASEDLILGK